jgi:PAS domain S-box-containing protein
MSKHTSVDLLEPKSLLDLVRDILTAADLASAYRVVAGSLRRILASDGASVMRVRRGHLEVVATVGKPASMRGLALPIDQVGAALSVLDTRRPIALSDAPNDPLWRRVPGEEQVRSWLAAPFLVGDQVLGILEATAYQPGRFGPHESNLIEALADQVGPALYQAQLLEEARLKLREISHAPAKDPRTQADLDQALQQIVDEAQQLTGAAHAFVFVLGPSGQHMRCAGAAGAKRRHLRTLVLSADGSLAVSNGAWRPIPGWFRKGHPDRERFAALGIQAGPILPLRANEQLVGFLGVGTDQRGQRLASETLQLLAYLSSRASLEIERLQPSVAHPLDYEAAVRSAPLGICVTSASGEILASNPALGNMVGRDSWDLVGEDWQHLLPTAEWQRLQHVLEEVSITGEHQDLDLEIRRDRDDRRQIRFSLAPTTAAGSVSHGRTAASDSVVAILEDVTSLKILEQERLAHLDELREKNLALQELDRLKSQFVSNVSHELRNPLAVIKLYSALARKGRPEKRDHYLQTMERETQRLETMVENVLNLSQLDRGTVELHFEPLDVVRIVHHVVEVYQESARARKIDLENRVSAPLPNLWADEDQLIQILTNLLDNALKFTAAGGQVWIEAAQVDGPAESQLEVRITDTGPGIPPEEQDKVFERFYRGRNSSPTTPGTGLGLAIVKDMVRLHRGEVELESTLGQGSMFRLRFPLSEPQP